MRVFAAGKATAGMSIDVRWRGGRHSVVTGVKPNRVYEVDEAAATDAPAPGTAVRSKFFKDVSPLIRLVHHQEEYKDFGLQPLLPKRFSTLGPGVCWCDFNGDGWDDLIIASGRGGEMGVFANDGKGEFNRVDVTDLIGRLTDDQTTVLGWPSRTGAVTLLVGVADYESGVTNYPAVVSIDLAADGVNLGPALPLAESSAGPLALADVDGDGALDLFVGGRITGGRYPEPASSRLYRSTGGKLQVTEETRFDKVGLVSGAVFSDLDGDGWPELLLACEWGPVRVFRNAKGKWIEATDALGLGKFKGWWNSVTTGDFDGDGRMDIVAGNWGRNTKYQRHLAQPLRVYYGDWDGDGLVKLVEAHFAAELGKVVPWRHWDSLSVGLPFVKERFDSFKAYSEAGVREILAGHTNDTAELSVHTLDSMLFLNRGDHFEAVPLPREAQLAPVFGLCVGDLDGDGNEDIFLSQNFFAVGPGVSRYNAGRGLWLKGDGAGNFKAMSAPESGVSVYGEQRGAALCDYDGDGRVDLVVSQNGAATKLFHNEMARPGLRVQLKGPTGNPNGVGAVARLLSGRWTGPAREVHAGSGYWSQDSPVQVLGGAAEKLWVRWPGGATTTNDIPKGAKSVAAEPGGNLQVIR